MRVVKQASTYDLCSTLDTNVGCNEDCTILNYKC